MSNQVKELSVSGKKTPNLPIPISKKAGTNLIVLQGQYQIKYEKKISLKALGTRIFERVTIEVL